MAFECQEFFSSFSSHHHTLKKSIYIQAFFLWYLKQKDPQVRFLHNITL